MTALEQFVRLESLGQWRQADGERIEVIVSFGNASLMLRDIHDRPLAHWALPSLRIKSRDVGSVTYYVDPDDDETLEIDDAQMNRAIEVVSAARPTAPVRSPRLPAKVWLGFALAVLASLVWWAPDMFRRYVAGSIPPIQSEQIGDQVLDEILALQAGNCSSTVGVPAAKALLSRLFTPETHWKLVILPLNERPTAALPGGHLLVSSALLAGLHEPDELAGYIALEAAHADSAPLLAELLQGAGLGATWRLMMTGQLDPQAAGSAAAEVLQGNAIPGPGNDAQAVQILQQAGIGSRPFAAALLRQGADAGRAATYDQAGTEGATPALADQDWVALQDICAG